MSRSAFFFCIIFFSLLGANAQERKHTYSIQGTLSGLEDSSLILLFDPFTFDGTFEKDTAILLNGNYTFTGYLKNPQQVAISYVNSAEEFIFWLDTGIILIESKMGKLRQSAYSGSAIPALMDNYLLSIQGYMDTLTRVNHRHKAAPDPEESAFWMSERNKYEDSVLQCAIKVIEDNPQSYYAVITLIRIRFQLSPDKFDEMFLTVNEYWAGSYGVDVLTRYSKERNALKAGDVIWDFTMVAEDGEMENLSLFKGHYIYLDFWASYCAPCLKKMPYLDSLQSRTDSSGFVIVTLTLDYDKRKWKSAVSKNTMYFNNFQVPVEDPLLRNKFVNYFDLQTIPRTFLLGPDLSLILVDPSEKELEEYLKVKGLLLP